MCEDALSPDVAGMGDVHNERDLNDLRFWVDVSFRSSVVFGESYRSLSTSGCAR